jgi:hypothetical protein
VVEGANEPQSEHMNLDTPKSTRHRIGLYIEIPGLKMTPLAALCHAEAIREEIRRPLKYGKVLWEEPLPPSATDEVLDAVNQIARLWNDISVKSPPASATIKPIFALVEDVARKIMTQPGVQCFAYFNWFFVLADVSDAERGASIIRLELERLNLLQYAEIAHIDPVENCCRTFYPPGCIKPFERHLSLVRQLSAYGKNLLQGGIDT